MRRARPDSVGKSGGSVPSSKLQVHGATLQHETCQQASPQKRFHSPALHCVASVAVIAGRASAAISATSPRGAVFQEGKDRCERTARMRCELNSSCVGCRNVSGRRVWFVWISRSFAYSIQQCRVQLLVARKFMSCSSAACPQTTRGPVGNEKNR